MASEVTRRTLLRGLGAAVALPWMESLATVARAAGGAGAAAGKPPVRLCFWYVPNGVHLPTWFPSQPGTLVDLPETLRPLSFARDAVTCFEGLTHNTALTNGDTEGCGHGQGAASFLTGAQAYKTQDAVRVDVSADQLYARHVGNQTRFPSLELGCESARSGNAFGYSGTYKTHISWRTPTSPAPYELNPKIVFDRLFTTGGGNSRSQATVAERDFYRKSLLDYVSDDARRVRDRVGKEDRRKLDQYLTGVREVERRIQLAAAPLKMPGTDVVRPAGIPEDFDEHLRLMCDLMVLAFQTDSTRASTFMVTKEATDRNYPWLGFTDGHHELSHHANDEEKNRKLREIDRYHISILAYMVEKMMTVTEADGSTLLDNSLVLYGSGISDGDRHDHVNLPVIVVGKGGGRVPVRAGAQVPGRDADVEPPARDGAKGGGPGRPVRGQHRAPAGSAGMSRHFWLSLAVAAGLTSAAGVASAQDAPPADLKAEDVDARRAAAWRLRSADAETLRAALPAMIEILNSDKDGQVRLAVFDALTAMGPDAGPAVPALLQTLKSDYGGQFREETHQDYRAALALAAVGAPSVEGLRGLLDARKENVRAEVVMALGRIGPSAAPAVPDLVGRLSDESARVRQEAAVALGRVGSAAAGPLIAAAVDERTAVRAGAFDALARLDPPDRSALNVVIEGTGDADPGVRAAALRALAAIDPTGDTLTVAVRQNLGHDDARVRTAVLNLLAGRPEMRESLAAELDALLLAENADVARQAAYLIALRGPDAVPSLLNALGRDGVKVDLIAGALAGIGRAAVGPLTGAVGSPDPGVRRGAALALGQVRPLPPGTVATLSKGLADPVVEVRSTFLEALGALGPRASDAAPEIRRLLRDDAPAVRSSAVAVLAKVAPRDEELPAAVLGLLDDPDAGVQRQAIETIRALGPAVRNALGPVVGKLGSPEPTVRLAAVRWIGSQGPLAAEAVPALIALLDDPAPELRSAVAETLGTLGKAAQPAFDRLTGLLVSGDAATRQTALLTIASLELDVNVIRPHIAAGLRDEDPEVARAGSRAIQRLGPQGALFLPDIIELAGRSETQSLARGMLRRFERRGPDARSIPELVGQLGHEREPVRLLAIRFLGLGGTRSAEAVPALEALRDDPSEEVRKQAESALEKINAPAGSEKPTR